MNKTELIAAVAEKADLSKKDAEAAITATVDAIAEALTQGEKVQLVGFGSFEVKTRAARVGRNPRTGEEIPISEACLLYTSPSARDRSLCRMPCSAL